jgi:4-hydroxy-tetrahydrodipicolinate synthase
MASDLGWVCTPGDAEAVATHPDAGGFLGSLASSSQESIMSEPATATASTPATARANAITAAAPVRGGALKASDLRGVFVPLVTPFEEDGRLDEPSFLSLAAELVAAGVDGLLLAGTTGESPTLHWPEIERLLASLAGQVRGRVPLLVGTGTNDTAESVERTARARQLGADGAFAVCPYYNRPSPAGVVAHYRAIAAVGLPTVAYHIPYRTGLVLDRPTLEAVLAIPGIIGLKESSGGLDHVAALARAGGPAILCGEEALFLDALEAGAHGGILAAGNLLPHAFVEVQAAFAAGQRERARAAFARVRPLVELLFADANPAPLKWALHHQGRIRAPTLRLPMAPIGAELAARLEARLPPGATQIERLVQDFEAAAVPAGAWNHRAHLIVGTSYVHRHGACAALERLRSGILRLNRSHGTPETESRGYHETITVAYVTLLEAFLATLPAGVPLEAHVSAVLTSPLYARDVLLQYYSRALLFSPAARRSFHPPDLRPLDGPADRESDARA